MEENVAARYGKLTSDDIKSLVVEAKWLATLVADVQTELDRVSLALTARTRELAQRYESPLPRVMGTLGSLGAKVDAHLRRMGASWA